MTEPAEKKRQPYEAPYRWKKPGSGTTRGSRMVVMTYLDAAVVEELREQALRHGVSLSEQMRRVVEWGLASMEELKDAG